MGGKLNLDEIIRELRPFGPFQWISCLWLWLATGFAGMAVVAFAFVAFVPPYRCNVPECNEVGTESASYFMNNQPFIDEFQNISQVMSIFNGCKDYSKRELSTPVSPNAEQCRGFLQQITKRVANKEDERVGTCSNQDLIFDKSIRTSSLVFDTGLTCNLQWLKAIVNATYMLGMLVGSFVLGLVSDTFGRKVGLLASSLMVSIFGTLAAFTTSYVLYGFLRFLVGCGGMGLFMISFVYSIEITTPEKKVLVSLIVALGWTIGEVIFTLEAYLIRDWVNLQIVTYAPAISVVLLWFILPESARWLVAKKKYEEAERVLRKVAKANNVNASEQLFSIPLKEKSSQNLAALDSGENTATLRDCFSPRPILWRTLNMSYQWFSVTMSFYGITFALTELSGDPYLNFLLGALCEIPGILIALFLINFIGRRFILSILQFIAGASAFSAGLLILAPQLQWLRTTLALIGKFGSACAFLQAYLYTCELYPTSIRATVVGFCSTVARVGGIISLMMGGLTQIWPPFPMVIMGIVGMVAGGLAVFFPETTGIPLPETMQEALEIKQRNKDFKPFRWSNHTREV